MAATRVRLETARRLSVSEARRVSSDSDDSSSEGRTERSESQNSSPEFGAKAPEFKPSFRFWCIIIGLGLTSLLGALENTVVSTAAPVMLTDLQLGEDFIWITNAFFVCSAAFQPLFGQLCNVFGRRWVTIAIVAIFTLGSGLCGGAVNGNMLIAGRAVQGIGSGGIIMVIDIIVADLVPLRQRGTYMAVVLGISGLGTALGPFIGGAIVSTTSWRWVFYMNLPIGGVSLIVLYLSLHVSYNKEMSFARKMKRIDFIGNGILMAGTVLILYSLSTSNHWPSWQKLVPLLLGVMAFVAFGIYEASSFPMEPVMPPRLFSNRTSAVVSISTFLNAALLFWVLFFLPVYFQAVLLFSPWTAGVSLLPQAFVGVFVTSISSVALGRWGKYKLLHFGGFGNFALGVGLFLLLDENTSTAEWVAYSCVCALGFGMVLNTMLAAFQAPASEADQAASTAAWGFIRTFGYVWGVAIPAAIFNSRVAALAVSIPDPVLRESLAGGNAYQMAAAQFVRQYPLELQQQIRAIYREALQRVWQVALAFAGLAFLLVFLEKEIPLRTDLQTEYGLKQSKRKRDMEVNQNEENSNH